MCDMVFEPQGQSQGAPYLAEKALLSGGEPVISEIQLWCLYKTAGIVKEHS